MTSSKAFDGIGLIPSSSSSTTAMTSSTFNGTEYMAAYRNERQLRNHFNTISAFRSKSSSSHAHQYHRPLQQCVKTIQSQQNFDQRSMKLNASSSSSSSSPMNALFTWKKKTKNLVKNVKSSGVSNRHSSLMLFQQQQQQQQHQHQRFCDSGTELPPKTLSSSTSSQSVPPSLARLFSNVHQQQQQHQQQLTGTQTPTQTFRFKVDSVTNESKQVACVCRGLTGSTFMAPSYFDDDDRDLVRPKKINPQKQSSKNGCGGATIRSRSTDSLFDSDRNHSKSQTTYDSLNVGKTVTKRSTATVRPFRTINEKALNVAKSLERLVLSPSIITSTTESISPLSKSKNDNRRSILECKVNPYELVLENSPSNDDEEIGEFQEQSKPKSKPNSIRIAGQTIYSSMKNQLEIVEDFDRNHRDNFIDDHIDRSSHDSSFSPSIDSVRKKQSLKLKQLLSINQMRRSKSSGSLSSWSFDSNSNSDSSLNPNGGAIDEPEPDYDLDEENNLISNSDSNQNSNLHHHHHHHHNQIDDRIRCESSPPKKKISDVSILNRPKNSPPPPPPPPPPEYFSSTPNLTQLSNIGQKLSDPKVRTSGKQSRTVIASTTPIVDSYQNELKEKLNLGIKSILKKTNTIKNKESFGSTIPSLNDEDSSRSSTAFNDINIDDGENGSNTPISSRKHVHFRMKRHPSQLNRSASRIRRDNPRGIAVDHK
ncbi:hypothetical protein QR98_0012410 [Sarcoptes scabiei]|uniref:Uncharacterized protein n=1 Tax=Sarcoptes scabiei TaxID=52283 RepID=A0A131ZVG2_SARSC|nr:hypothetical protein QR98_0012410 [Sarcoptes scabiei]